MNLLNASWSVTYTKLPRPMNCMMRSFPTRHTTALLASLLVVAGPQLFGQANEGQTNPPQAPAATAPVSSLPTALPTALAVAASSQRPPESGTHEIEIEYTNGKLAVEATNASLNQILREVAHKTGIKITGGVAEERVFGQYGPAPASVVLAELLDGTGSNMLLVDDSKGPAELILTARRGGPTPPNPSAAAREAEGDEPNESTGPQPVFPRYQPPTATGRGPVTANPDGSPSTGLPTPPADSSQPANGPSTPQQIYEQLQKQRQQATQNPPQ